MPRTEKAVTQRYYNVLKGIEDFGAALDEQERTVLEQAVREVDTKAEYWWCVAARYNDIRKTRKLEDMRELNKTLAKKWAGKGEVEVKVNGEGKAKGEVGKVKMDGGQVKRELEGKGKVEEEKGPVRKSGRVKKEVLE